MVNDLAGRDWIPKWEAKVVMAVVTKAQTLGVSNATILCISGGRQCDLEMARQPALVRAIRKEMGSEKFSIKVSWMDISDFRKEYHTAKGAANNTKETTAPRAGKGDSAKGNMMTPGPAKAAPAGGKRAPVGGEANVVPPKPRVATSSASTAAPARPMDASRLSVRELKQALAARGVDSAGCLEKSELVALLGQSGLFRFEEHAHEHREPGQAPTRLHLRRMRTRVCDGSGLPPAPDGRRTHRSSIRLHLRRMRTRVCDGSGLRPAPDGHRTHRSSMQLWQVVCLSDGIAPALPGHWAFCRLDARHGQDWRHVFWSWLGSRRSGPLVVVFRRALLL
jgi:hypothetical protein